MRRLGIFLLVVILAMGFYFCDKSLLNPPTDTPAGSYQYTARDSSGVAVVTGSFTLTPSDSDHYSGEWHFKQIHESIAVGPQLGDGELQAGMQDDVLWINLNPNMVDNNVFLHGTITDGTYSGMWEWSTFIGPTTGGKFEAAKL